MTDSVPPRRETLDRVLRQGMIHIQQDDESPVQNVGGPSLMIHDGNGLYLNEPFGAD
jgi:hypothetical protein